MTIFQNLLKEESASEAIDIIANIAGTNNAMWALVGGMAIAFYSGEGFT